MTVADLLVSEPEAEEIGLIPNMISNMRASIQECWCNKLR
jgi:hypothetical protein